jgi:DNA-binding response OmpR family regulator
MVKLLGELEVEVGAAVLGPGDWRGRKPKQLLEILLTYADQPVPKERLAELMWPVRLPDDPMRALEAYASVLRARLHAAGVDATQMVRSTAFVGAPGEHATS